MDCGLDPDKVIFVDWMREADLHIFRVLSLGDGLTLNAAAISRNIDYNRGYISERCRYMTEIGVLDEPERAYFRLTDEAFEAFAEGDTDRLNELANLDDED